MSLFCRHKFEVRFIGQTLEGVECVKCGKATLRPHGEFYEDPPGWLIDADEFVERGKTAVAAQDRMMKKLHRALDGLMERTKEYDDQNT